MRKYLFSVILVMLVACSSGGPSGSSSAADQGGNDTGGSGTNGGDSDNTGNTGNGGAPGVTAIIADHTAAAAFDSIPASYVSQAINNFKIYYGHTSHGSQIITGLEMLQSSTYDANTLGIEEESGDLGSGGDTAWADTTRTRLNQPGSNVNVVIWSWCGGVSGNTTSDINIYLNTMNQLEQEYPSVKFIYMTGHTDGSGAAGTLRINNKQIRDYCRTNNKLLFDFEDVESSDPGGTYYPDTSDDCGWCSTWCASHTCPGCGGCAHSHCFNCYLKGKAFWWLVARMAGWTGS
jgi:hypothetical protein